MFGSRAIAAACTSAVLMWVIVSPGLRAASAATIESTASAASALVAGTSTPTCGGSRPIKPGGGRYACTFTEDFTGSTLDAAKWVVQTTAVSGFTTGESDCYLNSKNNIAVSGGSLHLTARVETSPTLCKSPVGDFTSTQTAGSVVTWGKFAQTYGRFEFRAKFPATTTVGIDSALWMVPQALTYGQWPNSGEIDVAEWFGNAWGTNVYPSVHYAGEIKSLSTGYNCPMPTATTSFHTYAVNWTPTSMSFYYDNKLCYQHAWTPLAPLIGPQPFDKPFVIALTQAGGWGGPAGSKVTMDVDWVRAWK